jgi:Domain of unknown function (DUF4062)
LDFVRASLSHVGAGWVARIYVSSTSADLSDHRKEVSQAIRRLGHEDVAMEYYVVEDARPVERCLSDVGSCDVYVGIFAWRFGYIPAEHNPGVSG